MPVAENQEKLVQHTAKYLQWPLFYIFCVSSHSVLGTILWGTDDFCFDEKETETQDNWPTLAQTIKW